jgi:hypothetical protein
MTDPVKVKYASNTTRKKAERKDKVELLHCLLLDVAADENQVK